MADDLNRLLIKIQADTSQLASALQRAEAGVAQSSAKIERTIEKNSAKFKKWGGELASQLKGLAAGYMGLELASKGLDAVHVVADLEDQARAAGVTTDKLQELNFAAKMAGASSEDLAKGLDKFNVSMAGVRLNTGAFNQFLKDQAPALRDALVATKSQEEAIAVLSDAMAGLGDDSQRATLGQQAFGEASRKLNGVLSDGSRALDASAQKAHEFGGVLTKDYIKKAKEAEVQFAQLETAITTAFQKAAVAAAQAAGPIISTLDRVIEAAKKAANGTGPGVWGFNPGPMPQIPKPEGTSFDLHGPVTKGWDASVAKAPSWSLQAKPDDTGSDALANLKKQFDQSNGNIQQALQDQYDQELKSWQEMLDKKQITESQFAEARTQLSIIMLNAQKENLGAETQQQKEYYSQLQGLMNSTFMDTFGNALETGKLKADDFFKSMLQGFAKVTMQALVLKPLMDSLFSPMGGGGLGGLLGGLFGGFLAEGGPADSSKPYIVGERGPELFVPNSSGRVKSARETDEIITPGLGGRSAGGRSQGSSTNYYNYAPVIDARGADTGVLQRIEAAQRHVARNQQSPVTVMNQARKRFPTR